MRQYINRIMVSLLVLAFATSCVDTDVAEFTVDKPQSIAEMEYLNGYGPLKSYIDRNASPNFKLGAGVDVSDFLKQSLVYNVMTSNFDEVTAGNAMKYSSVVADNGAMDFSKIKNFVTLAQNAGITIYGHTLGWHAQQNNKYLNGLIADKTIEVDPDEADNALHINTPEPKANPWDWELYYNLTTPLTVGVEYTIGMRGKASAPVEIPFWPGDGTNTQYLPPFALGTQWGETSVTFVANHELNVMRFCFGTFGGDLYFDDLYLKVTGSDENLIANPSFDEETLTGWTKPGWHSYTFGIESMAAGPSTWWTNLVTNSDCEGDDTSCFFSTEITDGPKASTFGAAGTGADGVGRAIVVKSGDNPTNSWDTQFFLKVPRKLLAGEKYRFSMKYKADKAAGSESQAHNNPGEYQHWSMLSPNPSFTTEWQEKSWTFTVTADQAGAAGMSTIAFNLSVLTEANTYYFDDIMLEMEESGNSIPQTPEEKKEVLTGAMETWVAGMMEACEGYVTVWDVINEAISGRDVDGDGIYELQSVTQGTVSESDAQNNFYWQDYLGDIDYVRTTIKFARQYFAESGGNPADLKLFINDYNLESDWDDNRKLKSLIDWIERWEADGTVVDGIGTQMHVSCYANPDAQKSKEDHIVKMYELMAKTGKLVKVSELDMGYVDADGTSVLTENMTEEQHKAMSEFYTFIIKKYFEIIPVAQQYGITQWATTDSPAGSSWRGGSPIGLWSLDYNRKHTYSGFAVGLGAEDLSGK